jgi:ABC-type amino acid transport substrate-binding protein
MKRHGLSGLMIIAAVMTSLVPAGVCADRTVMSVLVLDMPPWFFQRSDGAWDGFGVELAHTLVEKAGYRIDAQLLPWNRAMEYLKSGQALLFVNLSKTPQREEFVDFIGISASEQTAVIVRHENAGMVLNSLDDLVREGYVWGIRDKSFYSEDFNRRLESDSVFQKHFEPVPQFGVNALRVKAGRIIGAFGDLIGLKYKIRTDPQYEGLSVLVAPFFPPSPVYFGVSRQLPVEMRNNLRLAYEQLQKQNAFDPILGKWTGSITP